MDQASRYSWAAPTTDVRALQSPDKSERRARTWYHDNQIRLRLNFSSSYNGTLHLYALDWDSFGPRGENVTVDDGRGPRTASLTAGSFVAGAWVHVPVTVGAGGSVLITIDRTASGTTNAVLSGLFLGGGATPPPPATAPGAPLNLAATAGNGQVALTWAAPTSDGGSSITGYTATASPGGATCSTTGALGCTVSGLTNGTAYSFTVKATNSVGTGPASAAASATPATVPGAPTGLTATPGNAKVDLAWTAPASNGGSAIMGYTATASPGGAICTTTGAVVCTIGGLTNGTSYTFTVKATNSVGTGPASASAGATPTAPATAPGAPLNLAATAGNGQVALTWAAPTSDRRQLDHRLHCDRQPGWRNVLDHRRTPLHRQRPDQRDGLLLYGQGDQQRRDRPRLGLGECHPVRAASPPGAPTGLTATPGNAKVDLAWTAPASDGGSPITGYRIYRGTTSGAESLVATLGVVTTYTDTGRTNGTTYFYQVAAVNAAGEGARSARGLGQAGDGPDRTA